MRRSTWLQAAVGTATFSVRRVHARSSCASSCVRRRCGGGRAATFCVTHPRLCCGRRDKATQGASIVATCGALTTSQRFASRQRRRGGTSGGLANDNLGALHSSATPPSSSSSSLSNSTSRRNFYDKLHRGCLLCDEVIEGSYNAHMMTTTHLAHLGVYDLAVGLIKCYKRQLLTGVLGDSCDVDCVRTGGERPIFCDGVPSMAALRARPALLTHINLVDLVLHKWWRILQPADASGFPNYHRLPHLSADQSRVRRWRLSYLLTFFKQRGVLRDSVAVKQDRVSIVPMATFAADRVDNACGHSNRFERCETIGDFVLKPAIFDRLVCLAEGSEAVATEGFFMMHTVLENNMGLRAAYDYLKMNRVVGTVMANNKAKADVVEAVIGELHTFLLATGPSTMLPEAPCSFDRSLCYLCALVEHFINELLHTLLMWRLEKALRNVQSMIAADAGWPELVSALEARNMPAASTKGSSGIDRGGVVRTCSCAAHALPELSALPHPSPLRSLAACEVRFYAAHCAITHASVTHDAQCTLSSTPSLPLNALLYTSPVTRPPILMSCPSKQPCQRVEVDGATGILRPRSTRTNYTDTTAATPVMPDFTRASQVHITHNRDSVSCISR